MLDGSCQKVNDVGAALASGIARVLQTTSASRAAGPPPRASTSACYAKDIFEDPLSACSP